MAFAPKPGCPMCGIVASALHAPSNSPRNPSFPAGSTQPEVLWRDENFTAYREKANPVSSKGHIIIAFNLHVPSLYTLSSTDLPLLVKMRSLAQRLLPALLSLSSPALSQTQSSPGASPLQLNDSQFRIGFITPPFWDSKIPVTDHLHAHAYILPTDQMGWFRGVAYSPVAWYPIEDLIAEIRESSTNNRVKSGYESRPLAPIDMVPSAGARTGTADGIEVSEPGLAQPDLEDGHGTPALSTPKSSATLSPQSQIPHLRV